MSTPANPPAVVSEAKVFELMREGQNAVTFRIVQETSEQSEKIRRLAEATREIETPFFPSYFTA